MLALTLSHILLLLLYKDGVSQLLLATASSPSEHLYELLESLGGERILCTHIYCPAS